MAHIGKEVALGLQRLDRRRKRLEFALLVEAEAARAAGLLGVRRVPDGLRLGFNPFNLCPAVRQDRRALARPVGVAAGAEGDAPAAEQDEA